LQSKNAIERGGRRGFAYASKSEKGAEEKTEDAVAGFSGE
jgi:hypothetical protein